MPSSDKIVELVFDMIEHDLEIRAQVPGLDKTPFHIAGPRQFGYSTAAVALFQHVEGCVLYVPSTAMRATMVRNFRLDRDDRLLRVPHDLEKEIEFFRGIKQSMIVFDEYHLQNKHTREWEKFVAVCMMVSDNVIMFN